MSQTPSEPISPNTPGTPGKKRPMTTMAKTPAAGGLEEKTNKNKKR